LGLNLTLILAGMIGSFIGLKKGQPFWVQALTLFTGAFIANYATPLVIEILGLTSASLGGLAFILGYLGKHGLELIIDKVKNKG
jgi:hypothetical protein